MVSDFCCCCCCCCSGESTFAFLAAEILQTAIEVKKNACCSVVGSKLINEFICCSFFRQLLREGYNLDFFVLRYHPSSSSSVCCLFVCPVRNLFPHICDLFEPLSLLVLALLFSPLFFCLSEPCSQFSIKRTYVPTFVVEEKRADGTQQMDCLSLF